MTSAVFALDDAVVPVAVGLVVPLGQGDLLLAQVADDLGVEVVEADALALDVDLEQEADDEAAGGHQLQPHQQPPVVVVARVGDEGCKQVTRQFNAQRLFTASSLIVTAIGSHHHWVEILVPDDKQDCFV